MYIWLTNKIPSEAEWVSNGLKKNPLPLIGQYKNGQWTYSKRKINK